MSAHWVENSNTLLPFLPTNNEDDDRIVNNILSTTQETIEVLNVDLSKLLKVQNFSTSSSQQRKNILAFGAKSSTIHHLKDSSIHIFDIANGLTNTPKGKLSLQIKHHYSIAYFESSFECLLTKYFFKKLLSNFQESPSEFIDKDVHAKLIYDYNLFDIPKLLDICVLYGSFDQDLIRKLILTLFGNFFFILR